MAGGLLNLVSKGESSQMIYGNPEKTLFKKKYKSITNFGLQKFKIDYIGNKELLYDGETTYRFVIPRHGDLLYDCYLSIDLPDIYSPLFYKDEQDYVPYEFQWIKHIGSMIIKEIHVTSGGATLSRIPGEYLMCMAYRDYSKQKLDKWNDMTGNVKELYDPAYAFRRDGLYPNAIYQDGNAVEPSIRGRTLYIPISAWFSSHHSKAFPLVSTSFSEFSITITLRKITDLYRIRNIEDPSGVIINNNKIIKPDYISPDPTNDNHQMYRFLQQPPNNENNNYANTNNVWNSNIYLLCTYVFLDSEERIHYASKTHTYLFKDIYNYSFYNIVGSNKLEVQSHNLVTNYMWRFRRSDALERNEWTNYTNWTNEYEPYELSLVPSLYDPSGIYYQSGIRTTEKTKDILIDFSILFDGKYRENTFPSHVYEKVERFSRTNGKGKDGLYNYSFELKQGHEEHQPSGGVNMSKFDKVIFEIQTIEPPLKNDPNIVDELCDDEGNVIAVRKNRWDIYNYTYDVEVFEERYNRVIIKNGLVGLEYAR